MNEHDYDGKCPNGCPMCTPDDYMPDGLTAPVGDHSHLFVNGKCMCGEGDYMPLNRVNQAYKSFVMMMDMIADQGENASETMALETIEDILSAWLDARETRELIRFIVTGVRTGDIAPDAEMEIAKSRHYLVDQGLI